MDIDHDYINLSNLKKACLGHPLWLNKYYTNDNFLSIQSQHSLVSKQRSIGLGFLKLINKATYKWINEPILIHQDDVALSSMFSNDLFCPKDADIIWLGHTTIPGSPSILFNNLQFSQINQQGDTWGCHALLLKSSNGRQAFKVAAKKTMSSGIGMDTVLSRFNYMCDTNFKIKQYIKNIPYYVQYNTLNKFGLQVTNHCIQNNQNLQYVDVLKQALQENIVRKKYIIKSKKNIKYKK